MVRLSVNVNKIATLRNARGRNIPNLLDVIRDLMSFGVKSITVHPRPDGRHILYQDVKDIKTLLSEDPSMEFNVESYPSISFLELMEDVQPHQCTLVPDSPSVLTSNAGWRFQENRNLLQTVLDFLRKHKIRSSLFLDPLTLNSSELAALYELNPDCVELYTEHYASTFLKDRGKESIIQVYVKAAQKLSDKGIQINAGHDLDLNNLAYLLESIPQIQEVSIGHALICESLYQGLKSVVDRYLQICNSERKI